MGPEAVATLSTKEIGKYALNGIFCCKEFSEARVRLKNEIDTEEKKSHLSPQ